MVRRDSPNHWSYPVLPTLMSLVICPMDYFAFKNTLGTAENGVALVSLLNAIHFLELGRYTLTETDLAGEDMLDAGYTGSCTSTKPG